MRRQRSQASQISAFKPASANYHQLEHALQMMAARDAQVVCFSCHHVFRGVVGPILPENCTVEPILPKNCDMVPILPESSKTRSFEVQDLLCGGDEALFRPDLLASRVSFEELVEGPCALCSPCASGLCGGRSASASRLLSGILDVDDLAGEASDGSIESGLLDGLLAPSEGADELFGF